MIDKLNILSGLYVDLEYVPAPIVKRIVALSIDRFIQYMILILVDLSDIVTESTAYIFYIALFSAPMFLEYLLDGQTIGKKIMKIVVVTDECTPPSFSQCAIRSFLYVLDFWLVGAILISKKAKRLGDMASGCMVVLAKNSSEERVSLKEDYRYTVAGYKPTYPEVREMDEIDWALLPKILYDVRYVTQLDVVAHRMEKHLGISKGDLSDKEFLLTLRNDYLYYEQVYEE
ncbi:MAG: RDD family protein [Paludibacteraceae bacterium]|nr:RDD family protein [Paludibacteraceae bacterium]